MNRPDKKTGNIYNPVKRTAIVWWTVCGVLILAATIAVLFEMSEIYTSEWASAVMFVSLIFGIIALVMAIIYTRRANITARMLIKENLLAHWTYTADEWQDHAEKEYINNRREKRNIFIATAIISLITGGFLSLTLPEKWLIFVIMAACIVLVMGLALWLSVWTRYRQNQTTNSETYISPSGAYINHELHIWNSAGAALNEVIIQENDKGSILVVTYSVPNLHNRQFVNIRIPVPAGEEKTALRIMESLRSQIRS